MAKNKITYQIILATLLTGLLVPASVLAQRSLYQDVKANKVGDIITVILQESTSGSSTSDSKLATNANGQASGSITGNFIPFEPTFGSGANVTFDSDQRNLATQRQLLEGLVSVQIVEVTNSGDLLVEGNRLTEVNGEVHKMSLSGTVRPNDVNGNNEVFSYRIANANISYQKQGGLRNKRKDRGLLKKIIFTGVSVGLGAAAALRALK